MVVSAIPAAFSWACFSLVGSGKTDVGPAHGGAGAVPARAAHSEPSPLGAQESCSQRCGDPGGQCSCHPTCVGLGTCCSDLRDFCLEIVPYSGSMMGGKDFVVQHLKWSSPTTSVICRWEAKGPCILEAQTTWLAGRSPKDQGQGQLVGWVPQGGEGPRPSLAQPLLPPLLPTGLRRASRPSATWTPSDVCTVCRLCFTRLAASPSRSPWTMAVPSHAQAPGWLVSPTLLIQALGTRPHTLQALSPAFPLPRGISPVLIYAHLAHPPGPDTLAEPVP